MISFLYPGPCRAALVAAVVVVVAACGDDDTGSIADAGAPDASSRDASQPDARVAADASGLDAEADAGAPDGGDASLPIVGEDFVDFGAIVPRASGVVQVALDVPADARSLVVTADPGAVPRTVALLELRGPSGDALFDATADPPLAFDPASPRNASDHWPYSWMLPSSPERPLEAGRYRIAFYVGDAAAGGEDQAPVAVDAVLARGAAAEPGALSLVIWSVSGGALPARAAAEDPQLQAALSAMVELYAEADIELGPIVHRDLAASDVELARIDDDGEVARLLALLAEHAGPDRSLDIVLVDELAAEPGKTVLAKVTGVPGPPAHPALGRRGAVIFPLASLSDDSQRAGALLAHESAHYLGLRHTSEYDGLRHDPIADTPECPQERASFVSSDGEPVLSAEDCDDLDGTNLMFYTPPQSDLQQGVLTVGQRAVLRSNPLVR